MADKMLTSEDVRKAIRLLKGRGKASNTDVVEVVRGKECKKIAVWKEMKKYEKDT